LRPVTALLTIAMLATARPSAAQDARVYTPTGDGGRYVKLLDPKTRVAGYHPAAVEGFRAGVGRVIAQIDAMPAVNRPPPGICHQLNSWIELHGALDARVLSGSVEVMRPLEYRNGRCIKTNNALLMIGLNRISDLVGPREAHLADVEGQAGRDWYVLRLQSPGAGRIELARGGYRVVALTRAATPLFTVVSAERYAAEQVRRGRADAAEVSAQQAAGRITEADVARFRREERPRRTAEFEARLRDVAGSFTPEKLAEMRRAHAEGLDLAERTMEEQLRLQQQADERGPSVDPQQQYWLQALSQVRGSGRPACLDFSGRITTLARPEACRPGQTVMEINPAYYDAARPGDLQLVTLVTPERPDSQSAPSRDAIWRDLDIASLARLVR
jgi:hypothetical protein